MEIRGKRIIFPVANEEDVYLQGVYIKFLLPKIVDDEEIIIAGYVNKAREALIRYLRKQRRIENDSNVEYELNINWIFE